MSRISGLRNNMNIRTFYKERRINKWCIHFLSKQSIKAPLILEMYGTVVIATLKQRYILYLNKLKLIATNQLLEAISNLRKYRIFSQNKTNKSNNLQRTFHEEIDATS